MITLISTPTKTIEGRLSNVVAARSQAFFKFTTDLVAEENYKININVLDTSDLPLIEVTFKYSFKPDGSININLGRIVTEINEARGALATTFKIEYYESYTGFEGAPVIIADQWLAVYGEKQLLSIGGANMYEYLLKNEQSKLATVFKNPCYWSGFDRLVSFVVDSNFNTRTGLTQFRLKSNLYDINKQMASTLFKSFISDLTPRVALDSIVSGTPFVGVSVSGLSEEILYELKPICSKPIMIDWLNSKGGVDQWLFNIDQVFQRDAGKGISYEAATNEDIEFVNRTKFRQSPKYIQQVILKADNLKLDQLQALEEIKSSISVRAWLNNDGEEWIGVIASSKFTTQHNSSDMLHSFTLQLEFPDNFDFNKGQKYFITSIEDLIDSDGEELIDSDLEILEG